MAANFSTKISFGQITRERYHTAKPSMYISSAGENFLAHCRTKTSERGGKKERARDSRRNDFLTRDTEILRNYRSFARGGNLHVAR